jgi:hypothetical protein
VVLAAYRMSGNVSFACEAGDIGRRTFYHWLDDDPEFSLAALEARDDAADSLEQEAWRRAYQGTLKPVYQGGKHVGDIREYDTTLTIFLLKALRPAKFRERFDATLTVDTGLPQPSDQPADDTHARLLENLRSARGAIEATSRDHAE